MICIDHGSCILPSDMAGLTNTARPSVMFSIGCWPAAFDTNCIAERFVNNNDGGGVAFIGNSRYGWGSPGNPGQGYSEVLDRALCEEIFSGNEQLGAALAIAKARYAPYARWANVWRWVIFQLNLLGDPATAAITGYSPIEITYEIEGSNIGVTATTSTSAPANGAIVAAFDNYGLVDRAIADDAGFASLNIEAATIPVFITARFGSEGFAAETLFTPAGDGFFHYWYAPTFGYSDYSAEPGDTVETVFSIGDFDSDLTGITWAPTTIYGGAIWTTDPPTSIFSGDSAVFSAAFIIPSGIRPDTTLVVEPNLSYSGGDIGFPASFSINCPVLQLAGGLLGDSDSSLEPGEIAQLWVLWENTGDGGTQGETADVSCPGGELDISGYPVTVPFTRPGDTAYVGPFDVSWASGEDPKPIVPLFVSAGEYTDTLYLATVSLGFSHDAETSDDPFTLGSPAHLWHRSTRRPYNGSYSWWCGDNFSGGYLPSCDDYITTDPMVLGANAELSFMAYLAFPNYGSDGLYIEILGTDESDTTELDFLGSGGALLSFIVGWSEYRYNLDDVPYSPGDTIRIRFRFLSDLEDEDEGVFIDDIELTQTETYFTTGITEYPVKPERFTISAYPNPFNSAVNIRVSGLGSWVSDIQIFDINGRRIAEIPIYRSESVKPSSTTAPGVCRWTPDESLGSGIYLLRTKGTNASIKIVYLK
ncbi:hypothetical protein DRQ36_06575 [bacterium]|nr:MAG: hypothetical protein DRQ36_06575 [bacterium]